MKEKYLALLPLVCVMSGCALVNPRFPVYTDFKDGTLRRLISSAQKNKNTIIEDANIETYVEDSFNLYQYPEDYPESGRFEEADFDFNTTPKNEYAAHMPTENPQNKTFVNFENRHMRIGLTDSYEFTVDLVDGEYVLEGVDILKEYMSQAVLKGICDVYFGDYIYDFGLINAVKAFYDLDFSTEDFSGKQKITDSTWYEYLKCIEKNGDGTFKVGLTKPFDVEMMITASGAGYSFTLTNSMTINYLEANYKNHLADYLLIHATTHDKENDGKYSYDNINCLRFRYNVAEENEFDLSTPED